MTRLPDGDVIVQLVLRSPAWLTVLSIATLLVGMAVLARVGARMIRRVTWPFRWSPGSRTPALGLFWLRFVYLSDFFQMIWLADAQRAGVGTAWANGFLGFGYPALLNLVTVAHRQHPHVREADSDRQRRGAVC